MKIVAIDDELIALKNLELKLGECVPDAECRFFQNDKDLLQSLSEEKADIAFLDIRIGSCSGLVLAKSIREICSSCAIIFLTGHAEYAVDAFKLKANGYLLKPFSIEDLRQELAYLGQNTAKSAEIVSEKRLVAKCFGSFDVFYEGKPISFTRNKSKELLAYLIDRNGAQVNMPQIASVLWADGVYNHSRNNQIHSYLSSLSKDLHEYTKTDIINRKWNAISIDVSKLDCDYFRFLQGDVDAVNQYTGEYMSQYWWAEFTTGSLTSKIWH